MSVGETAQNSPVDWRPPVSFGSPSAPSAPITMSSAPSLLRSPAASATPSSSYESAPLTDVNSFLVNRSIKKSLCTSFQASTITSPVSVRAGVVVPSAEIAPSISSAVPSASRSPIATLLPTPSPALAPLVPLRPLMIRSASRSTRLVVQDARPRMT